MTKLVKSVHLFDRSGVSILTGKFLQEQNASLEKENDRLREIIRRLQARVKQHEGDNEAPLTH